MTYRSIIPALLSFYIYGITIAGPAVQNSGVWLDVPFVKQEKDGCGAASVAMVMEYWLNGRNGGQSASVDADKIYRELYTPGAHGVYASAMELYFRQQGFNTFAFHGEWNDLLNHLRKGRPLIVALKPQGDPLHYVVIAGFDPSLGVVLLNDPARRKLLKQDQADFERQWSAANGWTLLALPQPEAKER